MVYNRFEECDSVDLAIILAAGEGTRMRSKYPKVLKKIFGRTLLDHVMIETAKAGITRNLVIIGHGADEIEKNVKGQDITYIRQPIGEGEPYGTGFAVMQAMPEIGNSDSVVVLCGDSPLIRSESILMLLEEVKGASHASVLTADFDHPYGYGRIIKNKEGLIEKIVEEREATPKEKEITEINSGVYAFRGGVLKDALKQITNDNQKGEYYLTDVIEILGKAKKKVSRVLTDYPEEALGVNTNTQLSYMTKLLQRKINNYHMAEGVEIVDPENTIIYPDVAIGRDTVIYPGAVIENGSIIGEDVIIRGDTRIINSKIGDFSKIESSVIEESVIGSGVKIGPYAHVRPHSNIRDDVKLGNFVEVKNSNLGKGTKVSHLTYIGDCDVGEGVNFGCGSVIVNYDGKEKHRSSIGNDVFIGCNANIISPLSIGDNSYIAAGSTITKDVSEDALAIERGEQMEKKDWVKKKGLKK